MVTACGVFNIDKLMQVMLERDAGRKLEGEVQVDDACLGGERTGGKRGRGSESKTPFLAAVQVTGDSQPVVMNLARLEAFRKGEVEEWAGANVEPGTRVHSDGTGCFRGFAAAGCKHVPQVTGAGRAVARRRARCETSRLTGAGCLVLHVHCMPCGPDGTCQRAVLPETRSDMMAVMLRSPQGAHLSARSSTTRSARHLLLALCLVAMLPSPAGGQAEFFPPSPGITTEEFPNLVLITGDHLRWDHVAANGNSAIITPHMDRLAKEGVTFRYHFTVGQACAPNRASLMTGRYPHSHGVISNGIKMPEDERTLTHVLREAGYYTGQMGKLHFWPHKDRNHREYHPPYGFHQMRLSDEPGPYDDAYGRWLWAQGKDVRERARVNMPGDRPQFERYAFEGEDSATHASWVATETITFIEDTLSRHPDRPFFVHSGFYAPHPPLNPPASSLAPYRDRPLPPRHYSKEEISFLPRRLARGMTAFLETPEDTWDSYRRFFYAMVTHLDENVGRIMAAIEEAGIADRTIFVLTSDHGDYLGDHNLVSKSARPYDGALRIPLIFRGPEIPTGTAVDELAEIVDIMPTLMELLGIPQTKGSQGMSLVPAMHSGSGRDVIYMQTMDNRMIRTKSAKYWIDTNGEEVLFDYSSDPHELRNVAADDSHKELLDDMRVLLIRRSISARDPLPERIRPY